MTLTRATANGILRQVIHPAESTSLVRRVPWTRTLGRLAAAFVVPAGTVWVILSLVWPPAPIQVHVRWKSDVADMQRAVLERRFQLTGSRHIEGSSWEYQLVDVSTANIRAIVQSASVDDTEHLNRARYRPEFAQDRSRQILVYSLGIGIIGSMLLLIGGVWIGAPPGSTPWLAHVSWSALTTPSATEGALLHAEANYSRLATAMVVLAGVLLCVAMKILAAAALGSAALAFVIVYACGYLVGSLLVWRTDGEFGPAWAVIRTTAGLLLTTIGFLLSLVASLPWFFGPGVLLTAAVWLRGRSAFAWPHGRVRFGWDGFAAAVAAGILLSPVALTFFWMAPGSFPPVFYNIDTAYFLEKVHALAGATIYPPESLSNVGVRRTYHYGTQAMAALISRGSGLLPHHSLFLIVLPLLTSGVVATAVAAARYLGPGLPRSLTVPFLLLSTPSFANSFWGALGPRLWAAAASPDSSGVAAFSDYSLWGFLSNEGQNIGGDFVTLGSIAAIAAAPSWGWILPAFLVGTAILVKTPVGVALVAGFMLAEAWQAVVAKRLPVSSQMIAAGVVFVATFVAFFVVRLETNFRVELFPLFHLRDIVGRGSLAGFAFDALWLFLPVLVVLSAGLRDPDRRSAPILLMGIAPVLVVNATRMDNIMAGGGGTGGDWLQMLHPVPFLFHAFAISLASMRWDRLGRRYRTAFLLTIALVTVPVAAAAARYSVGLLRDPQRGNEFVDNRSLAEALAVIPTKGTVIVTNDLRYPAQNFTRDYRQMQIPALFGHQAFAVNYAHEAVEERRPLQQLLQQPEWSGAIEQAAVTYHWTHLLIRKDYVHPRPIPLQRIFENDSYEVFGFQ